MKIIALVVWFFTLYPSHSGADSQMHHHTASGKSGPPPKFEATTNHTFTELMDKSMEVMDYGMHAPPATENPDRDFLAMMIPHHQGAVDMAKALLLYGKDKRLRGLALQIITDQEIEIQFMKTVLKEYDDQKK